GGAARLVRGGLAELSSYQASFGSIDLQTASAVHGRRLAELGLAVALSGRRPAAVLAAAERARAASSRLPRVRPPEDPVTAGLLAVTVVAGRLGLKQLGAAGPVVEEVRRARADLDVLAQPRLPGGLLAAVHGSLVRSLQRLDDVLVRPLQLDDRRLVIVSTG